MDFIQLISWRPNKKNKNEVKSCIDSVPLRNPTFYTRYFYTFFWGMFSLLLFQVQLISHWIILWFTITNMIARMSTKEQALRGSYMAQKHKAKHALLAHLRPFAILYEKLWVFYSGLEDSMKLTFRASKPNSSFCGLEIHPPTQSQLHHICFDRSC